MAATEKKSTEKKSTEKKELVTGTFKVTEDAGIQFKDNTGNIRFAKFGEVIKTKNLTKDSYGVEKHLEKELKPAP